MEPSIEPTQPVVSPEVPAPKKKKTKLIIILSAVGLVVVILLTLLVTVISPTFNPLLTAQLKAVHGVKSVKYDCNSVAETGRYCSTDIDVDNTFTLEDGRKIVSIYNANSWLYNSFGLGSDFGSLPNQGASMVIDKGDRYPKPTVTNEESLDIFVKAIQHPAGLRWAIGGSLDYLAADTACGDVAAFPETKSVEYTIEAASEKNAHSEIVFDPAAVKQSVFEATCDALYTYAYNSYYDYKSDGSTPFLLDKKDSVDGYNVIDKLKVTDKEVTIIVSDSLLKNATTAKQIKDGIEKIFKATKYPATSFEYKS